MNDWIQRIIAGNFADLAGLHINGEIPVREQLINEVIAEFLKASSVPAPAEDERIVRPAAPDLKPLLKLLRKATIRADAGVITINFEINA